MRFDNHPFEYGGFEFSVTDVGRPYEGLQQEFDFYFCKTHQSSGYGTMADLIALWAYIGNRIIEHQKSNEVSLQQVDAMKAMRTFINSKDVRTLQVFDGSLQVEVNEKSREFWDFTGLNLDTFVSDRIFETEPKEYDNTEGLAHDEESEDGTE